MSEKQRIFRPITLNARTTKDWTSIAWPTHTQSGTSEGKFGPAKQMKGWHDCWFLSALAVVANGQKGREILAQSIKKMDGGYVVTFKGLPKNNVFIPDQELDDCLNTNGGDAATRLMELAADKLFSASGNFQSLFIAANKRGGRNQAQAEQCLRQYCERNGIQDPQVHNPMRGGSPTFLAFFMFTDMYGDHCGGSSRTTVQRDNIIAFLKQYITNDRDGAVSITGITNPLGDFGVNRMLVRLWDVIRTDVTSNGTIDTQQRAFLNALDKWLETRISYELEALKSAADNLQLSHINPAYFVEVLSQNLFHMNQDHFNVLRSGVSNVLSGGSGYIGFSGYHCGTIEGINESMNTFTYCEPYFPTVVHTGELSGLIQAIESRAVSLAALKPTTKREARKRFEHASTSRGRRLRQLHNQAVRDGKIDQTESAPLADLMEMGDDTFRQIYDSDKNGVIEGGELKAVQKRVDRWVEHCELTPIW